MTLGGIVLCGGKSSRMGRAKAWLPFGPEVMLQRVVRTLRQVVDPVVVVTAPCQDVPPLPDGVGMVRDDKEYDGPLRGLAGGLAALHGRCDAVYLSACDVPFLQASFVQRLAELRGDCDVCVPFVDGFHHPLAAVYHANVLPIVQTLLLEQRLRPVFLFEKVPTRIVTAEELQSVDPQLWSLRNLNTPDDYATALQDAGFVPTNE